MWASFTLYPISIVNAGDMRRLAALAHDERTRNSSGSAERLNLPRACTISRCQVRTSSVSSRSIRPAESSTVSDQIDESPDSQSGRLRRDIRHPRGGLLAG
jgi:hypothetical protein